MKSKLRFALWALAFSLIPLFAASIARAQAPRTYVSADKGNDAKKCTSDQPCRTFTKALTEVAAGGEVVALDSGDYEPFIITKSVTVQAAPGVYAGIAGKTSLVAVEINAGGSDVIVLRGLTLNGLGGAFGIFNSAGKALHVESCLINGFSSSGIILKGDGQLFVNDTIVRNMPGGSGIDIIDSAGGAIASIDRSRVEKNGNRIFVRGNARVAIRDSIVVANFGTGINTDLASSSEGPPRAIVAELTVENCLVAHNATGIFAFGAIIRVSSSTISDNEFGLVLGPASAGLLSRGNNTVEGNGTDGSFSGAFPAK